ncbi:MAG: Single-stranded DNA-binding protein [Parcubacteria group bacterium GW2011_GWA2_48_9]|nr:MAG: Single-stranded DNA-binding protein [Parcubacteria group bacterium GW2011_GWA2_48_9]
MNYNRAIIIGNITKDPELKALPSGGSVCNFSIATNRTWMDKTSGKKQEAVEFHNVVVFGRMADNVAQYIRKGSQLLVEGRIQTRSWEGKDGKKNYRTEIVAESIQFGAKPRDEGRPSSPLNEEQEIDIADIPF